jgi:hypothetical protein
MGLTSLESMTDVAARGLSVAVIEGTRPEAPLSPLPPDGADSVPPSVLGALLATLS